MISEVASILPKFNNYEEEGRCDDGYETLQDFFLSWTLRSAADRHRDDPSGVQEYARRMMYYLVHGRNENGSYYTQLEPPDDFRVLEVRTRRQKARIDLIAEVEVLDGGNNRRLVLSIENKWYSPLRSGQLKTYRDYIEKAYSDREQIHLFITCDDCRKNYHREKEQCAAAGYKYLTIDDIASFAAFPDTGTGNTLFDAYWAK